jgi:hypothetical protein
MEFHPRIHNKAEKDCSAITSLISAVIARLPAARLQQILCVAAHHQHILIFNARPCLGLVCLSLTLRLAKSLTQNYDWLRFALARRLEIMRIDAI